MSAGEAGTLLAVQTGVQTCTIAYCCCFAFLDSCLLLFGPCRIRFYGSVLNTPTILDGVFGSSADELTVGC